MTDVQLVSPDSFARKWNSKFEGHLAKHEAAVKNINEDTDGMIAWMISTVTYGSENLASILHAEREAKSIGLVLTAEASGEGLRDVWEKIETSKVMVIGLVDRFQGLKNATARYMGVVGWRDLPLSLHRRINDFVYVVGEIKASGKWVRIGREQMRKALENSGSPQYVLEWADSLSFE